MRLPNKSFFYAIIHPSAAKTIGGHSGSLSDVTENLNPPYDAPKQTLVEQAEIRTRSAPAALLLAGRRTFKKCGGISADKCPTACVMRRLRGASTEAFRNIYHSANILGTECMAVRWQGTIILNKGQTNIMEIRFLC